MNIKKRLNKISDNATEITTSSIEQLDKFRENFSNLGRDFNLLVSNLNTAVKVLGTDKTTLTGKDSELNLDSYESIKDVAKSLYSATVPAFTKDPTTPYDEDLVIGDQPEKNNERWFFVNGIATSKEIAKINGRALSNTFDAPIHLLYNPSQSIPLDLWESVKERTFNRPTEITDSIYDVVKDTLKEGKDVKLMGHSQGGIITSSVINRLVDDKEMEPYLNNIELYTFASAAVEVKHHVELSEQKGHPVPYNEHFVNKGDLVARIGKGDDENQRKISGKVFTADADGHLLNNHYLKPFINGIYDPANDSRLSYFYDRNKNSNTNDSPRPSPK